MRFERYYFGLKVKTQCLKSKLGIGTYQRTSTDNGDIRTALVLLRPSDTIHELRPDRFERSCNIDHILREYQRRCGCVLGGPDDARIWGLRDLRHEFFSKR